MLLYILTARSNMRKRHRPIARRVRVLKLWTRLLSDSSTYITAENLTWHYVAGLEMRRNSPSISSLHCFQRCRNGFKNL